MKNLKKLVLLFSIALVTNSVFAQGIQFFKGTYPEALQLAKQSNKNIFVDVYTTWCAPCKKMTKYTFTDERVGKYFNNNFIAIKLDAENQAESPFFETYLTSAFPSLFWLNSNGGLMDKYEGFLDAESFLEASKNASQSNFMAEYEALRTKWETEERTFTLYNDYVMRYVTKIDPKSVKLLTEEFIAGLTEEELKTKQTFYILFSFMRNADDGLLFTTLLKNWDIYTADLKSSATVWPKLYSSLVRNITVLKNREQTEENKQALQNAMNFVRNIDFAHKDMILESIELETLFFDKKFEIGIDEMIRLTEKYEEHPFLYNMYYYTLILNEFFTTQEHNPDLAEKLIAFTRKNAKLEANQQSMLFMATAYAYNKDYKTAYEYLASLGFYPKPMLSNAVYKKLNLPVPKEEFPW